MPRSRRTRAVPTRCVERRRSARRERREHGCVYVSATTSLVVRRPASPRRSELLLAYPRRNPRAAAYLVATTVMAELPDISHLTPEERRIIESVMMRQKQEEEQENEIMR